MDALRLDIASRRHSHMVHLGAIRPSRCGGNEAAATDHVRALKLQVSRWRNDGRYYRRTAKSNPMDGYVRLIRKRTRLSSRQRHHRDQSRTAQKYSKHGNPPFLSDC